MLPSCPDTEDGCRTEVCEAELWEKSRARGFADLGLARVGGVLTVPLAQGPGVVKQMGLQNPTDLTLNLAAG